MTEPYPPDAPLPDRITRTVHSCGACGSKEHPHVVFIRKEPHAVIEGETFPFVGKCPREGVTLYARRIVDDGEIVAGEGKGG